IFNNVTVRGTVYASQGTIDNVTIGKNCNIQGTLSANNIDGDVCKMFYLPKGGTVTIPATSINRVIAIPAIYAYAIKNRNSGESSVARVQIKVDGTVRYKVEADSNVSANFTNLPIDVNMQSYSFTLAAGQSCTVGYDAYQTDGLLTRLMDYLMVVASKA
ncbi:hypothetical protein JK212_12630, partial [Tatumella sp. JGM82]|nr:hypothetical protein [Tatumella sp. JGM82]